MQRKYDIKFKTLYGLLNLLSEYKDDPEVAKDIFRLNLLIDNLKNNFVSSSDNNFLRKMQSDLEVYPFVKPYYKYADLFVETGLSLEALSVNPSYTKIKISDEEAYAGAYSFLASQGDFFKKALDEFEESKYSHLKFVKCSADTDGGVYYLKTIDEAFVFLPNYKNFTKATILVHELEHVIDCFNNPALYDNYIVREIGSNFMEMVASDCIALKYGLKNDNYQRRLFLHTIVKEQALVARDKMDMLALVQKYSSLGYTKLIELLHEEGYSDNNLKYYCEKSLEEDFYYIIAQMVAIELYFIYWRDMEYALTILKNIIMIGKDYNILDILAVYNINLGENITNYEIELVQQLKKGN